MVIAGPGAGKTELLAQRACFLLQTGICQLPKRILAICFKRDAALNLSERVQQRCPGELGRAFDSMTFDAFAKGLLDRFRRAIPAEYRPTPNYEIAGLTRRDISDFLSAAMPPPSVGTKDDVEAIVRETFPKEIFHRYPLRQDDRLNPVARWLGAELWKRQLSLKPSRLTFPMIGRLANLLLRTNPLILRALQATYGFVFLDEFQDTTRVQFELTSAAFANSKTIVTAVGDNKQRIMLWAEALDDSFGAFASRFKGSKCQLQMNYRSAPKLVKMQRYLVEAIDPQSKPPKPAPNANPEEGVCRCLVFQTPEREAEVIANEIRRLIVDQGLSPRDICILVKQRAPLYTECLVRAIPKNGVRVRIESDIQDLLAEPLVSAVLPVLRLLAGDRLSWPDAANALAEMRFGFCEEKRMPQIENEVLEWTEARAAAVSKLDEAALDNLVDDVVKLLGDVASLKGAFPQYAQGTYLETCISNLKKFLAESCSDAKTLLEGLDHFEGRDSVPIMTIHKSKGLEYHTVIFIGLEDGAFWSFRSQSAEDTCAFFVAFSRAEQQVLFTFSKSRVTREGYGPSVQQRDDIGALYNLLRQAGVEPEEIA